MKGLQLSLVAVTYTYKLEDDKERKEGGHPAILAETLWNILPPI